MTKEILVIGGTGLVGSRFIELTNYKGQLLSFPSAVLDITKPNIVRKMIDEHNPDVVINFAAYTDVTEAENQRGDVSGSCWQTNVEGVRNISNVVEGTDTRLIQISTGYVFSGSADVPGPYSESRIPETDSGKVTWYGYTKGKAEQLVVEKLKDKATLVRIIYPVRSKFARKSDYLRKMLKQYDDGTLYPMFTEPAAVSISFVDEICISLDKIIGENVYGVFHVASSDWASPFEIASYLIERARGAKDVVKPSKIEEFIKKASNSVRYPIYGNLDVAYTMNRLNLKFLSWREIIDSLIKQGI